MKVQCICDKISYDNSSSAIVEWSNNSELEVTIGKTYTVIALTKLFDVIFYYLLGDESDQYPLAFPHYLFKIEDNKISKYWDTQLDVFEKPELIKINNGEVISFKEWSLKKDQFYEKLVEEYEHELSLFFSYRDKMLNE